MAQISYGFKTKKEDGTFSDEIKFATTTDLVKDNKGAIGNRIQILEQYGIERIIIEDSWTFDRFDEYGFTNLESDSGLLELTLQDLDADGAKRVIIGDSETFSDPDSTLTINDIETGILAPYLWSRGNDFYYSLEVYCSTNSGEKGSGYFGKRQIPISSAGLFSFAGDSRPTRVEISAYTLGDDILLYTDNDTHFWVQIIITRPLNK